jgi:hypothetical protein
MDFKNMDQKDDKPSPPKLRKKKALGSKFAEKPTDTPPGTPKLGLRKKGLIKEEGMN